ncbi:RNA polymerase sigma factor [Shewanella hanedai]|jgi:RNA polymerase sigma-70 factor (ECF subfamily)|uniref:Sigma-70 family RNA polymerase sigma factor n=1 Tax=Shewanella hanedai TaxID=25 RepID=A0A553JQL8_SHEHA|nr:sigma-70 family RNA polymerase sigma factor [Shewanella hanedai]TRY14749.1 sigma-70 family RNA polymerase sigma factor [Shewanella hanedai]
MLKDSLIYKTYLASREGIARVVSRIVPPHEIEDIVQETYVRLCQVENKENINSAKSFMFKMARNLALDHQKRANVRLVDSVDDWHEFEKALCDRRDEVYDNAITSLEFDHFCEAVRLLPLQCRKVFVLKKVYGYSQREIASELGLSESTVEKHISQGIKRCTVFMRQAQNSKTQANVVPTSGKCGGSHE